MANRHPVHENRLFFVKNARVDGYRALKSDVARGSWEHDVRPLTAPQQCFLTCGNYLPLLTMREDVEIET